MSERRGGFDAFVGNPPFAGKNTIVRAAGEVYIEWLQHIHDKSHGNADVTAHFFRRLFRLTRPAGCLGLIATNTIAQGDTRATGLQRIVADGGVIYAAERSMPWPGAAAVVVSVVHIRRGAPHPEKVLDGKRVAAIDSRLMAFEERADPVALFAQAERGFAGAKLFGQGFVLSADERAALVTHDPNNATRIQSYIGGEEVNGLPDIAPRRFVINFGHAPLEEAERWPDLLAIARDRVKPERDRNKRGTYQTYWWRLGETGTALYAALRGKRRCLVNCQVSRHLNFAWQHVDVLFAHTLCVFALDSDSEFAVMQSRAHELWARFFASSMKDDLRYTPSDCFETFPFPRAWEPNAALEASGRAYYEFRAALMVRNNEGLTATYNRFHDPDERDADILRLRELHDVMDRAVLDAYGWTDIRPTCEFLLDYEEPEDDDGGGDGRGKKRKKPWRWRWPDEVRDEVLARLLALNAERAAEEKLAGVEAKLGNVADAKRGATTKAIADVTPASRAKPKKGTKGTPQGQGGLFT